MNDETLFLGKPVSYWIALSRQAETLKVDHLIKELADTYAKLGYLENQVQRMHQFIEQVNKK